MKYKIEKDVPIPPQSHKAQSKYPFNTMAVGDSFALGDAQPNRVRSAAQAHSKRKGVKVVVRKTDDGTYRCWRIE